MRKSLLAFIVIALLAMVGVQSALAATTTYQLAYNQRECLPAQFATYHVEAQGTANRGTRFTVLFSKTQFGTYGEVAQSSDNVFAYASPGSLDYTLAFTGFVKFCARNTGSLSTDTVTLTLNTQ